MIRTLREAIFNPTYRCQAYILTNRRDTGWVGTDQKFKFQEHIQVDDNPLTLNHKDCYIHLIYNEEETSFVGRIFLCFVRFVVSFCRTPISLPEYLPSSLFVNKKEGDGVKFFYDGCPVEVVLRQQNHKVNGCRMNWEQCFPVFKDKDTVQSYLFEEDIPNFVKEIDYHYLSPDARYYSFEDQKWARLGDANFQHFERVKKQACKVKCNIEIQKDAQVRILTLACGLEEEKCQFIIDKDWFAFVADTKTKLPPEFEEQGDCIHKGVPEAIFITHKFKEAIDLSGFSFFVDRNCLKVAFSLQKC